MIIARVSGNGLECSNLDLFTLQGGATMRVMASMLPDSKP